MASLDDCMTEIADLIYQLNFILLDVYMAM